MEGARALIWEGVTRYKRKDGHQSEVGGKLKRQRAAAVEQDSAASNEMMDTIAESREEPTEVVSEIKDLLESGFMRAPSEETIRRSLCDFIDHTGNEAVGTYVCLCRLCQRMRSNYLANNADRCPGHSKSFTSLSIFASSKTLHTSWNASIPKQH